MPTYLNSLDLCITIIIDTNRLHSDKITVCISTYVVNTERINVLFVVVKCFPWGKSCKFNKPTLLCSFCLIVLSIAGNKEARKET